MANGAELILGVGNTATWVGLPPPDNWGRATVLVLVSDGGNTDTMVI